MRDKAPVINNDKAIFHHIVVLHVFWLTELEINRSVINVVAACITPPIIIVWCEFM